MAAGTGGHVRPVIPESTDELEVRIVEIAVVPHGEPLASETATRIAIEPGTTEMVKVSQEGGHTDVAQTDRIVSADAGER